MGGSLSFDKQQTKVLIKQSVTRLKILSNKVSNLSKGSRREIAAMLDKDQVEAACLKVEHIIRDDFLVEVYEILQLYLDMVLARLPLLDPAKDKVKYSKDNPPPPPAHEIRQAVATIIYSSQCIDVEELQLLAKQFAARFGVPFAEECAENRHQAVSQKVVTKLSFQTPESRVVFGYLELIAGQYGVNYKAPEQKPGIRTTFEGPNVDIGTGNRLQPMPPPPTGMSLFPSAADQPPVGMVASADFLPPPPPGSDPPSQGSSGGSFPAPPVSGQSNGHQGPPPVMLVPQDPPPAFAAAPAQPPPPSQPVFPSAREEVTPGMAQPPPPTQPPPPANVTQPSDDAFVGLPTPPTLAPIPHKARAYNEPQNPAAGYEPTVEPPKADLPPAYTEDSAQPPMSPAQRILADRVTEEPDPFSGLPQVPNTDPAGNPVAAATAPSLDDDDEMASFEARMAALRR